MHKIIIFIYLVFISIKLNAVPIYDELLVLHSTNTNDMNNIVAPTEGSILFNVDNNQVYEHNTTHWHSISNDGSETNIVAGNCIDITGIGTSSDPYVVDGTMMGKTKTTSGATCKQLLDTGCASSDGTYWINPDGGSTTNAFQVYCDMTTDGGGWTRLEYVTDLEHKKQFNVSSDGNRYLANNFTFNLTDAQINAIRAASTEGKQHYHGTCQGVIHHRYNSGNSYNYAFGFRYHALPTHETAHNQQTYPSTNIAVSNDGCAVNNSTLNSTDFDIVDIRVPVINVHSRDNGNNNERFGSPLTNNPAWLR